MNELKIAEIFGPTIQGEGPNVGARCIFVRVKGCSFKCSWCDSKFTWNDHDSDCDTYTPVDLAEHLRKLHLESNCNRIVLTGGNPCIYDFTHVIETLSAEGIHFDVETQGDLIPNWLTLLDTAVFSPKPPSSGMPDSYDNIINYILNNKHVNQTVAIKIPVFNDYDIAFARNYAKFINIFNDNNKCNSDCHLSVKMYLSVGNSDVNTHEAIRDRVLADYEDLLCRINGDNRDFQNVFILPQLHTLVWGNKQGV